MAFSDEQVEQAFQQAIKDYRITSEQKQSFYSSVNYTIVKDYLTGHSTSLQGFSGNYGIMLFGIINLLGDVTQPSANQQLVLDIIQHPSAAQSYMQRFFIGQAVTSAVKSSNHDVITYLLNQLSKTGLGDADILSQFIYGDEQFNPGDIEDLISNNVYLRNILLSIMQKHKRLLTPHSGSFARSNWSFYYFTLLEEVNPLFAEEYLMQAISARHRANLSVFATYKNGHYIPAISQFITNRQNVDKYAMQAKFSSAIIFYNLDSEKFAGLATEISRQYIEYYSIFFSKDPWESNCKLTEYEPENRAWLTYSACAFYLLFKYHRDEALQTLTRLLSDKIFIQFAVLAVAEYHLKAEALPYVKAALLNNAAAGGVEYIKNIIDLLQKHFAKDSLDIIWGLANNKARAVRQMVAQSVTEIDAQAETRAIGLLENKNAETRQTAALVLSNFNTLAATNAINKVLDKETNEVARDILLGIMTDTRQQQPGYDFITAMVAAAKNRGKLAKPIETWPAEDGLPPLFFEDGRQVDADTVRFLLYRMARVKEMRGETEAKYVIQLLNKEKAAPFALALIKLFIEKDTKPEYKYLMALAALLGNDAVVDKIYTTTEKWIEDGRYKMAEYGVGALAIQGSNKALRRVELYSRKYKSKRANIGAAALAALETAAEELNITIQELGDRIVPDFGFDGLFKTFMVNGDEYRAFIDSNFKMAFFDENNKKLKALPGAAGAALKEEFKAIAKEVRDITKSQSSRLEYYLVIQRKWTFAQWQQFFLQNPVMFIYATRLLWGVNDSEGNIIQSFTCGEDTTLLDVNSDEIQLDEDAVISIVHPSQLDAKLLQQWKQFFFDNSIEAIFPQLERKLPGLEDIDLNKSIITKFEGKKRKVGSIGSTLERLGWSKGPTGDGGMLTSFTLLYFEKRMEAILEVEGVGAGYGWTNEEKTGRLYVVDRNKVKNKWGAYPKNDSDEILVKLKDVPPIFLHEMLAGIEAIKPAEQ